MKGGMKMRMRKMMSAVLFCAGLVLLFCTPEEDSARWLELVLLTKAGAAACFAGLWALQRKMPLEED